MDMNKMNKSLGLVDLPPELLHKVAFSGTLSYTDVSALSQTCCRMKSIFLDDAYGRDIHHALKGVVENVKGGGGGVRGLR